MLASPLAGRKLWILPIALLVAALMVFPASAGLTTHTAAASPSSSGASLAVSGPEFPLASEITARSTSPVGGPSSALLSHSASLAPTSSLVSSLVSSPDSYSHLGADGSVAAPASLSSELSRINATYGALPDASAEAATARLIAEGAIPASVAYLPNLRLLENPESTPVTPTYNVSPAPMGIADLGLSSSGPTTTYTPDVLGSLTLNGYNASAGTLYQATGGYYWNGLSPTTPETPWQSGVQLNTVVTNISYPGANDGVFWTQNVVDFSAHSLQFIDNVWNFTGPDAAMNASTLYSYNGTWVVGDFYYAYGPTLPLSFPMTIALYNNASNVDGRSTVTFGYRVTEGSAVYTGVYDTVVFNSQPNGGTPLLTPDYLIDGNQANPGGLLYDAELVFGGPGGGSNAQINGLNGTMNLSFLQGASWTPAGSAFDYGADTGETAIGFSGWWAGSTEYVSQGPSMLYGLWNTTGGVASGWTKLVWAQNPSYAFGFVGAGTTSLFNMSWAPSNASGVITAFLPPAPTAGYGFETFADGYSTAFGYYAQSDFTVNGTFYLESGLSPNPGSFDAPLYMNGSAQAEALATDALGWTSGPYVYADIAVDVNLTFNHLNDWGFTEFDLFWAQDVNNTLIVSNLTQGGDSIGGIGGCLPDGDYPTTCYLQQFPFGYTNLPYYGSQIADWNSSLPEFTNEVLYGYYIPELGLDVGGAISLWNVTDAYVYNVTALGDTWGVWAASSPDLELYDSYSEAGATLTLAASTGAFVEGVGAFDGGVGVVNWGSSLATVYDVDAVDDSLGYFGLDANSSFAVYFESDYGSTDAEVENSTDATFDYVAAYDDATGVAAENDLYLSLYYAGAYYGSLGVEGFNLSETYLYGIYADDAEGAILDGSTNSTVYEVFANDSLGLGVEGGYNTYVSGVEAINFSLGVALFGTGSANVSGVYANASAGVASEQAYGTENVSYVDSTNGSIGVYAYDTEFVHAWNVTANGTPGWAPTSGVEVNDSFDCSASNVTAEGYAWAVNVTYSAFTTVSNVTVGDFPGVQVQDSYVVWVRNVTGDEEAIDVAITEGSEDVLVENVSVGPFGTGVIGLDSEYLFVENASAFGLDAFGVQLLGVNYTWVWNTTADSDALGVAVLGSWNVSVTNTTALDESIGVAVLDSNLTWANNTTASNWSIGVALLDSVEVHVNNVSATNPYLTSPWEGYSFFEAPTAAVVSEGTVASTVANVAADLYPIGLYDNGSINLYAQGVSSLDGDYGVMLNGTVYSLLSQVRATYDQVGVVLEDAVICYDYFDCDEYSYTQQSVGNVVQDSSFLNESLYGLETLNASANNTVTSSSFVGAASYGVALLNASANNLVYNNDFIGNNGATSVYSAAHIQAYSTLPDNAFNNSDKIGNYWADWHTYEDGVLAPYYVSSGAWDYHPLGAPEGTFAVTFTESGLPSGTSWSVTLNGSTETSVGTTIVFNEYPGSYTYTVGAIAGYQLSPATGAVVVTTTAVDVAVSYAALYTVSFQESGLPGATSWTVVLNGVLQSGTGTLSFSVVAGTYAYTVLAPSGYVATPSGGSVSVGANYLVPVSFALAAGPTYTVTVEESGLSSGTSWSAVVNGVVASGTGTTLTYSVPAGTYNYQIGAVAGYTVAPASGTVTVSGDYVLMVTYTPQPSSVTYTVTVEETGLASGTSWSAIFNGVSASGTGSTLTFSVTGGTYAYQVGAVAGYSAAPSSGTVTVAGDYLVSVTFTPVTYAVTFSESGLASGTSWTVTVGGQAYTTSGTSIVLDLANGSYAYTFGAVSGYTLGSPSGTVKVAGSATGASVSYGSTTSPSYVSNSTFNADWAIALGLAAVAVVLALVSLLRKPKAPTPAPASAWQEPPPASGGSAGGGSSGGSSGH